MTNTRERDYSFKPLKDYASLNAQALAEEWLKTPPNNLQRLFIYQASRKKHDFFSTINEKEQRQIKFRNRKEQKRYNLQENEVLIYYLDDMIHHATWRIILMFLFTHPLLVGAILILFDINSSYIYIHVALVIIWVPLCWSIRMLKVFQSKIFITNLRLGCCLTVFGKFNCSYYFLDFTKKLILADYRTVGADSTKAILTARKPGTGQFGIYVQKIVLVSIWQINDDVNRSFWFNQFSMISFLDCLTVLINERGGNIYIPEFIELGEQADGTMGVVYSHQFTGGDLNSLKEWYVKIGRLMASKTATSNPHLKLLSEIANYLNLKQAPDVQFEYCGLKSQLGEEIIFFTKMVTDLFHISFSRGYLCFTDKGLILADKRLQSIKTFCHYSNIRLKRLPDSVKLYSHNKCFCHIYFFRTARFPIIETLSLLGCARPNEFSVEGRGIGPFGW